MFLDNLPMQDQSGLFRTFKICEVSRLLQRITLPATAPGTSTIPSHLLRQPSFSRRDSLRDSFRDSRSEQVPVPSSGATEEAKGPRKAYASFKGISGDIYLSESKAASAPQVSLAKAQEQLNSALDSLFSRLLAVTQQSSEK
jgi:hypothetical protein